MSSTHGVQQNFLKLSVAYTKKNSDPVYEKQNQNKITTTQTCLSSSGKGDPLDPEKCALIFFSFLFFFFNQWTVCALCCVSISRLWRQIITTLYHRANSVQVGVKPYCFPFHWLCICVIHGVFKSSLSIIIFMYRASCVLCFRCSPVEERKNICDCSFPHWLNMV